MLQVGTVFCVFLVWFFEIPVVKNITNLPEVGAGYFALLSIIPFVVVYEIGYIIFRLGGTVVEKILKAKIKIKGKEYSLVYFDDEYGKFNDKRKDNPFLSVLSREYAFARTQATLFVAIFSILIWFGEIGYAFISLLLAIVFVWTARKHSKNIVEIMYYKLSPQKAK